MAEAARSSPFPDLSQTPNPQDEPSIIEFSPSAFPAQYTMQPTARNVPEPQVTTYLAQRVAINVRAATAIGVEEEFLEN